MADEPTVVVAALSAEYIRVCNKLNGAKKLLAYAHGQVSIESLNVERHIEDLHMLADAIISNGGSIPVVDAP